MKRLLAFWNTTVGKKAVMAVTGILMILYLVSHVAANLTVFSGPDKIHDYAVLLREFGPLLWVARLGLLAIVVLHFVAAAQLTMRARAARPVAYAKRESQVSTYAARTIRWGGVVILAFIVVHILHFTTGNIHPRFIHLEPYHNVVTGLQNPLMAGFYIVSVALLGLHLFHGVWSSLRTLGLAQPSANPLHRRVATVLAVALWLGFSIIPVAVVTGFLKEQPRTGAPADAPTHAAHTAPTE